MQLFYISSIRLTADILAVDSVVWSSNMDLVVFVFFIVGGNDIMFFWILHCNFFFLLPVSVAYLLIQFDPARQEQRSRKLAEAA